jgi:TatD DNase family protein
MLDTHCHVDLYPQPSEIAARAERAGVFTIMVTNLPSAFEKSRAHVAQWRQMRLALGLHPLMAEHHSRERERFQELVAETSYIGEVGLDFSREGKPTADLQVESFEFVLRALGSRPKFISIHSRRAEARVVELLKLARRSPAVFHWYTGPVKVLEQAVLDGHYFSVNPAMIFSDSGRKIVAAVPQDRILTETDGPFVMLGDRVAEPTDVLSVEQGLARIWNRPLLEARSIIADNFRKLIAPLRQ